jgi:hypothetical protein
MKLQNYLYHHGIKGQKWGVRRYQNEDGTLTKMGKRRRKEQEYEYKQFTGRRAAENIDAAVSKITDHLSLSFDKDLVRARKELEESVIDKVDMLPKEKQDIYVAIGKKTIDAAFKVLADTEHERREIYKQVKDLAENDFDEGTREQAKSLLSWYGPNKQMKW